jgi:hypothetical protein
MTQPYRVAGDLRGEAMTVLGIGGRFHAPGLRLTHAQERCEIESMRLASSPGKNHASLQAAAVAW